MEAGRARGDAYPPDRGGPKGVPDPSDQSRRSRGGEEDEGRRDKQRVQEAASDQGVAPGGKEAGWEQHEVAQKLGDEDAGEPGAGQAECVLNGREPIRGPETPGPPRTLIARLCCPQGGT